MTDLTLSVSNLRIAASAIQEIQAEYDKYGWQLGQTKEAKLAHVCLHLNIVSGRLAEICEQLDHQKEHGQIDLIGEKDKASKIIADLIYHASQIATTFDCPIASCVIGRYQRNAVRFCPDSDFTRQILEQ